MPVALNYLKKVNDNLGHEEGDRFIHAAANILNDAVGDRGEAYRAGGDEFNASEHSDIPLCFAYGHAICRSGQEYSIHDPERTADQEMYECKHKMKAERTLYPLR